jgi:hypothetical protein
MVRRLVGASVVAVLLASCSGSSGDRALPDQRPAGARITAGFVVAPGSRLVGPVFTSPYGPKVFRSTAVLDVDRDPVAVYDEYAAQARRLGAAAPPSGATASVNGDVPFGICSAAVVDELGARDVAIDTADPSQARWLHCYGSAVATSAKREITVESVWGGPSHHALIDVVPSSEAGTNLFQGTAPARPFSPLPKVTDRSAVTHPGAPFGDTNNAFEAGYRKFRLAKGSRVVADFTYTAEQLVVVLRVDGSAERVMADYARQLGQGGKTPEVQKLQTPKGSILMVESGPLGGGGATLVTDPSRHWILIRAGSD